MKTFLQILKLLPFPIGTAYIIISWVDEFMSFFLLLFFWWLIIPAVILSVVFFIMGLRWRNIWQRIAVVWGGANLLLLVLYLTLQQPNQQCNPDIMARHYEKHHTEMEELHSYVRSAIADSCAILLEFDGKKLVKIRVKGKNDSEFSDLWGEESIRHKDSLMTVAGLSQEEYDGIRNRLKELGCLGIEYSQTYPEQLTIWFRRVYMGLYSYNIYSRPMTDKEKADAMEQWEYIPYNDHCTFEYGGGAIGPQTFDDKEREDFLQRHQPW